MSSSNVIRWAGLSAVVAGVLTIVTQLVHPANDPSSVANSAWAIAHYLLLGSSVFGLLGISGIYARQVEESGLLGFVGFLVLYVSLALSAGFAFLESSVLPLLATEAPQFIEGFFAMLAGPAGESSLGALAPILTLVGLLYAIGGLLFGIAIIRAGVLPRWAAIVIIVGLVVLVLGAFLADVVARIGAAAFGLGLAWLGYALWSERREKASEPSPAMQT